MSDQPIYVTQPFLPPFDDFLPYLREIWDKRVLTNGGPFHRQLETRLRELLGVEHLALFANGTLALTTALKALGVEGEVITTPYTFVATAHCLAWAGIDPVFVDIDPHTLNLDPEKIEAAITPRTTAILPVHCYGTPCATDAIARIAARNGLRVIYDAAHAFAVEDDGGSVLRHGDLSILSFHATKVFSTLEGGAIVCRDAEMLARLNRLKNFGFVNEVTVTDVGLNGKLNEFGAAFGLAQLEHLPAALARRAQIDRLYREALTGIDGIRCLELDGQRQANHGYFPILVGDSYPLTRDELYAAFRAAGVHARRYFYPLVSAFPMYRALPSAQPENLRHAVDAAARVICLPIYPAMTGADQSRVIEVIRHAEKVAMS